MDTFEKLTKNVLRCEEQGYALYFRNGDEVVERVNGSTDGPAPAPIDFNTHFRLASVTKQFIACGIIKLVERGLLSFDTCIRDLYPSFPAYFDSITLKNLLNHTSGIGDYDGGDEGSPDEQVHDEDMIPYLEGTTAPEFAAGTQYKYNNTAYVLMGLIIEKVSGKKLGDYMRDEVFLPAGMNDTLVNYQGITDVPTRAYGHRFEDGKLVMKDQYRCSATIGDGGIYSTVNDLNKWIDWLLANRERFADTMFKANILPDGTDSEYGMGMRIMKRGGVMIYNHTGSTIGTNTLLLFSPDRDLRCVFLTNTNVEDTTFMRDNIFEML